MFVLLYKHLGHPVWTKFLIIEMIISYRQSVRFQEIIRKKQKMVGLNGEQNFLLTIHTKSSFTTDGYLLWTSSCTFSRPSLITCTHLNHPYHSLNLYHTLSTFDKWISLGRKFLVFKKLILDRILKPTGWSIDFNTFNAQKSHL